MPYKDPEKQAAYWRALYQRRKDDPAYRAVLRGANARHRARYPERTTTGYRRWALKSKYGMTEADFSHMFENQEGLCAVCSRLMCMCKTRRCLSRAEVDHDHARTGREAVRGLLCGGCNRALGLLRDRPDLARRAARYLETSHGAR